METRGSDQQPGPEPDPWQGARTSPRPRTRAYKIQSWSAVVVFVGIIAFVGYQIHNVQPNQSTSDTGPVATQDAASALHAWSAGGGLSRLSALSSDLSAITQAAGNQDTTSLRAACSAMQTDVQSAQAYASIPDATAQASWLSALSYLSQASNDCIVGAYQLNAGLIEKANSEIGTANDAIARTSARIDELAAH